MLFAEEEGFWKPPNIYDVLAAAGFAVAVASIWYAWYLSRLDIRKRLREATEKASEAARDEVNRVAQAVLLSGVSTTLLTLALAREACGSKKWSKAAELCTFAREQLARFLAQPATPTDIQTELKDVNGFLSDCVQGLRAMPKTGAGDLPEELLRGLDDTIVKLHGVDGRLTGIRMET